MAFRLAYLLWAHAAFGAFIWRVASDVSCLRFMLPRVLWYHKLPWLLVALGALMWLLWIRVSWGGNYQRSVASCASSRRWVACLRCKFTCYELPWVQVALSASCLVDFNMEFCLVWVALGAFICLGCFQMVSCLGCELSVVLS